MGANDKFAAALHPEHRGGAANIIDIADRIGGETQRLTDLVEQIRARALIGMNTCREMNEPLGNAALLTILALIERSEAGLP